MGCNCSDDIRTKLSGSGRNRLIGFVPALHPRDPRWLDHHVLFVREKSELRKYGRAIVVCACEPGHTRVGGSTAVIYGRNGKRLEAAFEAVPDPVVLVLLYEGTRYTGGALSRIQKRAAEQGREVHVYRFVEECSLLVQPLTPPPRLTLHRRWVQRPR